MSNWADDPRVAANVYAEERQTAQLKARIKKLEALADDYRKTGEQLMRDNAALIAENERLTTTVDEMNEGFDALEDQLAGAQKALRIAQNQIAGSRDMCDEDELALWDLYGAAIDGSAR